MTRPPGPEPAPARPDKSRPCSDASLLARGLANNRPPGEGRADGGGGAALACGGGGGGGDEGAELVAAGDGADGAAAGALAADVSLAEGT